MTETRRGLGPLGWRLLVAFVGVALTSVVVLTVLALVGTLRGITAGQDAARQQAADAAAAAAGTAYAEAGGWAGADLSDAERIATDAGARLVVRDASGAAVTTHGPGSGAQGHGVVTSSVVVDGVTVGSVRLAFGSDTTELAQRVAWTWILAAACAALVVAVLVALLVTRRITRPLVRLAGMTRAFASGDVAARPDARDRAEPGELGELARAFGDTADQLSRSDAARRRMVADLAHELRTPLTVLQAGLEELGDGLVDPDPERLTALHEKSVRLSRIVEDLAELSAAEDVGLSLRRVRVDLGELAASAVVAASATTGAAGLEVTTRVASGVVVDADPDRLHQVVGNLLVNTARYCRPGDRVDVTVTAGDGHAVLVVADTGPGIPAEDLPRVFDRLWRGRADSEAAGSGIGLAVVRELVTAHGGTVAVESDGATGSRFTVTLPLAPLSG